MSTTPTPDPRQHARETASSGQSTREDSIGMDEILGRRSPTSQRAVILIGVVLLVVVAVSACDISVFGERGSGNVITESRVVTGFDEIVLSGSGRVVVDVNGTETLTIEAEDNIMPLLTTEVHNGRLELGTKSSISPSVTIIYTISATALLGVSIDGSGDVIVAGVNGDTFDAEISGSGKIKAAGTTGTLTADISGSGKYDGADLIATVATASVSGSGNAVVNATERLDADVSGSGSVEYIGDPTVSSSISGSGDISRR